MSDIEEVFESEDDGSIEASDDEESDFEEDIISPLPHKFKEEIEQTKKTKESKPDKIQLVSPDDIFTSDYLNSTEVTKVKSYILLKSNVPINQLNEVLEKYNDDIYIQRHIGNYIEMKHVDLNSLIIINST